MINFQLLNARLTPTAVFSATVVSLVSATRFPLHFSFLHYMFRRHLAAYELPELFFSGYLRGLVNLLKFFVSVIKNPLLIVLAAFGRHHAGAGSHKNPRSIRGARKKIF